MGPKFPRADSPVRKFHFKLEATESTSADTFKSSSRPPIPNRHGEPRRRGCRRRGSTCGRAGERLPAPASRNCPGVHRPVRAAIRPPSVIPAGEERFSHSLPWRYSADSAWAAKRRLGQGHTETPSRCASIPPVAGTIRRTVSKQYPTWKSGTTTKFRRNG